jgi:hypothetical protein
LILLEPVCQRADPASLEGGLLPLVLALPGRELLGANDMARLRTRGHVGGSVVRSTLTLEDGGP